MTNKNVSAILNYFFIHAPEAFVWTDYTGRIIRVNNKTLEYTGFTEKDLQSKNILDIFEPTSTNEGKLKCKSGIFLPIEVAASTLPQKIILYTLRDISERKKNEATLFEQVNFYRQFTESIHEVFILRDTQQNKFLYLSPSFEKVFGYPRENFYGNIEHFLEIIHPEDRHLITSGFKDVSTGKIVELEYRFITRDNSIRWLLVHSYPIYNNKGEIYRAIGLIKDVTDRKKIELDLIKTKEKALESDRLKTMFLHNMSHEIRTPMNAIMGFSELMPQYFDDKQQLARYSEIITQRSKDLLDIINDILDIAKIESGQLTSVIESFKPRELFEELKIFFSEQQKKLKKEHISFNLFSLCDLDYEIKSDKVKLRQIFINLINNAFKFTNQGKIEGGCKFNEDHQFVFYVSDTGMGIPPEKHKLIFDRFTQIESAESRLMGGTGLGLPIVKGLVEKLGGQIWLTSEVGKGTSFFFTIDISMQETKRIIPDQIKSAPSVFSFEDKKILVVEDDPYNIAFIKEILDKKGLNIVYAKTGSEAIKMADDFNPDLILMDIRLPDMTGYEVTKEILKHKPQAKILAQTAYATIEDREKAISSGCLDYIRKPYNSSNFIDFLRNYLSTVEEKSMNPA